MPSKVVRHEQAVLVHWPWLVAILGMGIATYATRVFWFAADAWNCGQGRAKAALDALLPSVAGKR